ncbi:phage major capsid protein [Paraburkholderia sp. JHI869]|uniref:phage major capsid protein n=1 Tax=Paraburkholderia sp. JHI869 TaxID=3112959 RepID=UPI00317797C6
MDTMAQVKAALDETFGKIHNDIEGFRAELIDVQQRMAGMSEGGWHRGGGSASKGMLGELITKSTLIESFRANGQSAQVTLETGNLTKAIAPMVSTLADPDGTPVPPQLRIAAALQLPTLWRALQSTPVTGTNAIQVVQYDLTTGAAVQVEAQPKVEAGNTPTVRTCPIPTVAIVKKCSEQLLADVEQLNQFLNSELSNAVDVAIDAEVLHGDGSTGHALGLDQTATPFAPSADATNMLDALLQAIGQLMASGGARIVVGLAPTDAVSLATLKGDDGHYLIDPLSPQRSLWGATLAASPAVLPGTFYACASPLGAWCAMRSDIQVRLGWADDDFVRNLLSFRAEARVGPVTEHSSLVLKGGYTTSGTAASKAATPKPASKA